MTQSCVLGLVRGETAEARGQINSPGRERLAAPDADMVIASEFERGALELPWKGPVKPLAACLKRSLS